MNDKEILKSYEKYMEQNGFNENKIKYNIMVAKLLSDEVLYIFQQNLGTIDTYSFEEFTDMTGVIDKNLGGRDGIPSMLKALLELTEFLKAARIIKGGKIAYYKKMFSKSDYYLDKYDTMTGKKDDTKEFIKYITTNKFALEVINIVEDINVYDFPTIDIIDRVLNDIPIEKDVDCTYLQIVQQMLVSSKLLEEKNGDLIATKKGRCLSRLRVEERYAALLYLFFYSIDWNSVTSSTGKHENAEISHILEIFSCIYKNQLEVALTVKSIPDVDEEKMLIEISKERFRIARAESMPYGSTIIDICLEGMGLISISRGSGEELLYKTSEFGQQIFKLAYSQCELNMKFMVENIGYKLRDRKYDDAEKKLIEYLATYGGNNIVWDYMGQLLLLKKNFKMAYQVLKYAYESSSKRGKISHAILYHLVLCCRKLKLDDDIKNYEEKLQSIEKI